MAEQDAVWIDVLPSMKNFFPTLSKGAGDAAEKAGTSSGGRFVKGFGGMSKKLAGQLGIAFGAVSLGAAAAGLVNVGKTFEETSNSITKKTGATGAALDDMMNATKGVAMKSGASIQTIGDAVAGVHQRLNLTGKPLQDLSAQVLRLSQVTGTDLNTTLTNTTRMFGDWSIKSKDQSKALDALYKASSISGVGIDKLSESVVQYGAPLRQLGYSYEQSLAMIGKWNKEGVNSQLVLGGMRKALATMAKAGQDPKKEFPSLITQIQSMSSAAKAGQLAAQYFGTKAGPDMAAAIREGRFSIADMTKQISDSDGALLKSAKNTATLSGKWGIFKNQISVLAEPAAKTLLDTLTDLGVEASGKLTPAMERLNQGWKDGTGPAGQLRDITRQLKSDWASGAGSVGLLKAALDGLWSTLKAATALAVQHRTAVKSIAVALGSLTAAWLVAKGMAASYNAGLAAGKTVAQAYMLATQGVNAAVGAGKWVWATAKLVAHKAATLASTAATKAAAAGLWLLNAAVGAGKWVWATAKMLAYRAASLATSLAAKTMAAGQWLLNVALSANPIGLVILALVALGVAFAIAWKKSATFRAIVTGAWNGIKAAAQAVWGWLKPNVIDKMVTFFGATLPNAFRAFGRVFGDIWSGIKAAAAKPANFVINTIWNDGLRKALNLIPGVKLGKATPIPGYRTGGYTGDVPEDQVAGVTHGREYVFDAGVVKRVGGRREMDRVRAALAAGAWPVGPAGEAMGGTQNPRNQLSIPSSLTRALPVDLKKVIAKGPKAGAKGVGGAAGEAATRWGLGRVGDMGWYRMCLAFVNQAWGSRIAGLQKATARQSMNSVPRRTDGNPPAGSAVYWDTGGSAGHVALAVGDGTELSNDIMTPGMISRVAHETFAQKWGAKYMGWWSPDNSQPGANSSWLSKIKGFIGKAAAGAGNLFAGLLSSITGKLGSIKNAALKGLTSPWGKLLTGIPGWAIGKATSWAKSKISGLTGSNPGATENREAWRSLVAQALAYTHIGGGTADEDLWLTQIMTESSGNPNLIQSSAVYDVNIANGDPARGLVQVPGVTWADFGKDMGPFLSNWMNPLKNLIVGMRAASGQYRNWRAVIGKGHGYLHGTTNADPGLSFLAENGMVEMIASPQARMLQGGERVYNSAQTRRFMAGGGIPEMKIVGGQVGITDDGMMTFYNVALEAVEDSADKLARIGA